MRRVERETRATYASPRPTLNKTNRKETNMEFKSDSNEKFNEITKDMVLDGWEQRINSKGKVVVYAHFVPRTPVLAVEVKEVK
jgi:hypothetical protein